MDKCEKEGRDKEARLKQYIKGSNNGYWKSREDVIALYNAKTKR